MEISNAMLLVAIVTGYWLWFKRISRWLKGPRVWPLLGSLPGLIEQRDRMHEWITENLRACGGTYQTCIFAVPFLAKKQGLVTVTCDPKNLEHMLKTRFDNYPKGPTWQSVFHDLLGQGIFNSDGDTWLFQRKTAALEFTTRYQTARFNPDFSNSSCISFTIDSYLQPVRYCYDSGRCGKPWVDG